MSSSPTTDLVNARIIFIGVMLSCINQEGK
jgi:hypothetical protein